MTNWSDPSIRAYHKTRRHRLKKERPEYFLFLSAKSRARTTKQQFDIEESDIVIPEYCPILDIKLEVADTQRTDNSPSLDKINPSLGYTKGNVQVISWRANNLKRDATNHELHQFAHYYYKNNLTELDF